MEVLLMGFIRPMSAFANIEELRAAINSDILTAENALANADIASLVSHFFA
ncbi:hypothetical protein OSTOST_01522 [Ostertagia ostertagi]